MTIKKHFYRLEHQRMHEKHKGHDAMHVEMIIILFVTLILAQVALVEWKKRHYRSYSVCLYLESIGMTELFFSSFFFHHSQQFFWFYIWDSTSNVGTFPFWIFSPKQFFLFIQQFITLLGLWIIPVCVCIKNQWWRFIFFWLLFSCVTIFVVRKAMIKPVSGTTPRWVIYSTWNLICQ